VSVLAAPAAPESQALDVQALDHEGALEDLRGAWAELWDRCPSATPFQSPEWLLAWWRHQGGAPAWTVALRRGARLVGLAPFYVYTHPGTGIRQVTLVGNGITDHLDALVDPAVEEGGARILQHLADNRHRWDTADWADLHPASPLLTAPTPAPLADAVDEAEPCPVLALPADEDGLAGAVGSPRVLQNLRTARRRAEAMGEIEIVQADETNLAETLDALFRLHAARWRERGEGGVLDEAAIRAVIADAAAGFLARGWLRLYALRVGGRTAAVQLGWAARGRAYYYIGGWDPAFARISPGSLLVEHAVRDAVREGATEFDFLRGRESYKYAWGARDQPQFRRRLFAAGRA
jgi:CelD/BcsL family acetyltransferase involved in cellulose biosynthesis